MDALGANRQVQAKPPVPLQTYRWEDICRARHKGGYPWTHLYKRPLDDTVLDDFKIRADARLRKAKSSASVNRYGVISHDFTGNVTMEKSQEDKMASDDKENVMVESNDNSADLSISQYLDDAEREASSRELLELSELDKMHLERVKELSVAEEYEYWSKLQKGEIPNVLGSEWPIPNLSLKASSKASSSEVVDAPSSSKDATKSDTLRSERAKSEDPGRKRKHSIESSYSRVSKYSLSPQGILKKLKEAKDKIKLPKIFSKSESKLSKKAKPDEAEREEKKKKLTVKSKWVDDRVIIHIPLKPPPGETDEFSYLEFENQGTSKRGASPIVEERKGEVPETPPIANGSGVQLIILTAPSDDEVLDTPAVPETPSEAGNGFFEVKRLDELKKIATDAVDKYSPETKKKTFAAVKEEEDDDASKKPNVVENEEKDEVKGSKGITVAQTVVEKPPVVPLLSDDTSAKKKKKKVVKKDKGKETPKEDEEILGGQKTDDHKIQEQKEQIKLTIDVEDGLKTETVIAQVLDEDVKKSEVQDKEKKTEKVKDSPLLKKKVSFKRRSKEDSDEIYEDVLVTSEVVRKDQPSPIPATPTSSTATPKQDHDQKLAKMHRERTKGMTPAEEYEYWKKVQKGEIPGDLEEEIPKSPASATSISPLAIDARITKMHAERVKGMTPAEEYTYWKKVQKGEIPDELPPMEVAQVERHVEPEELQDRPQPTTPSTTPVPDTHLDERVTKMHQANVQGMSVAEEYEYWSRVNCHDYEPVMPPDGNFKPIDDPFVNGGLPKKPPTPITDSDIEFLAARAADIELRTTGIMTINKNEQDPGEAVFVPLESALKEDTKSTKSDGKEDGHGKKIQDAIQKQATNLKRQASIVSKKASEQAEKIQTRVKSIKKPSLKMPCKPKFERPNLPKLKIEKPRMPAFKIERPKMPIVKLPDKMKNISLSLPRKCRRSSRQPASTESTAGDSEKRTVFDFSTYPRLFRRKKREDDGADVRTPRTSTDITPVSERTTLPRFKFTTRWKGKFTKQPPSSATNDTLNSYKSKDSDRSETQGSVRVPLHSEGSMDRESLDLRSKDEREDSVERRMRLAASSRYDDDVDMHDAYMKENQEIHRASSLNAKFSDRWNHGTFHQDPTEQMVADLNEAKRTPASILKKIENTHAGSSDDMHQRGVLEEINSDEFFLRQKGISQDNIDVGAYLSSEIREAFRTPSNALTQLEAGQPEAPKRRPFKKPKRKKTPHVSQEVIQYDQMSIHTEPDVSISPIDDFEGDAQPERPKRRGKKKEDDLELQYLEDQIMSHDEFMTTVHYENQQMEDNEQPNILFVDSYDVELFYADDDVPAAPPRKHKSLRSLDAMSEHDSITGELDTYKEVQQEVNTHQHEYQIPTPDQPPKRPFRTRSRTRSRSRGTTLPDEETVAREMLTSTSQTSLTCNEEPTCKAAGDYMGYSVIDKSRMRNPPLPPCRRRSPKCEGADEDRFFTVPRGGSTRAEPVRPLRNYSTLGPSRPPRKRSVPNLTDEEKHIGDPYIEIEDDDHSKNLQSGEVIRKMKGRPLPAPPRPPRKARDSSRGSRKSEKSLDRSYDEMGSGEFHDVETSAVQTEPLSDDFECEALVRDPQDRIITPTVDKYAEILSPKAVREFEHQETITHGSLVVQPFAHGAEIPTGPIEMYSRNTERVVSVKREADTDKGVGYDETSEIPDEFTKLKSPTPQQQPVQQVIERIIEKHIPIHLEPANEVETLKAQKLQVADLDVERLAVNELHASKIRVGDIESTAINVSEINSNSGNLVVSGIELPASFFQQLVEKLQEQAEHAVAARPTPSIEAAAETVEMKESETNADTILALTPTKISTATLVTAREVRTCPPEAGTSTQDLSNQVEHNVVSTPTPEQTLKDYIGHEINEVISTAQQAVLQELYREQPEFGQKKTPFEVRLVEVESMNVPERPHRAVEVKQKSVPAEQPPIPISPPPILPTPAPRCDESEETPPPRPPGPDSNYLPSQSPTSFYALRSPPALKDFDIDDDIPQAPRRRRHHHHHHHKAPDSSSEDMVPGSCRRHRRATPEPSIPQLTGQLTRACYNAVERAFKRLIQQTIEFVMGSVDGKHEVNVAIVILIVFIALLFLVYWNGDGKQIHHHHWEYFNPPRDI